MPSPEYLTEVLKRIKALLPKEAFANIEHAARSSAGGRLRHADRGAGLIERLGLAAVTEEAIAAASPEERHDLHERLHSLGEYMEDGDGIIARAHARVARTIKDHVPRRGVDFKDAFHKDLGALCRPEIVKGMENDDLEDAHRALHRQWVGFKGHLPIAGSPVLQMGLAHAAWVTHGHAKAIVRSSKWSADDGWKLVVSRGDLDGTPKAWGMVRVGAPAELDPRQFNETQKLHRYSQKMRAKLWPAKARLYMGRITEAVPFEQPVPMVKIGQAIPTKPFGAMVRGKGKLLLDAHEQVWREMKRRRMETPAVDEIAHLHKLGGWIVGGERGLPYIARIEESIQTDTPSLPQVGLEPREEQPQDAGQATGHSSPYIPHVDPWDPMAVETEIRGWAGAGEDFRWDDYRKGFLLHDPDNAKSFDGYKLPFARPVHGKLHAFKAGVEYAQKALAAGLAPTDVPADCAREAQDFLGGYLMLPENLHTWPATKSNLLERAGMEETDNEFRYRLRDPGGFQSDTFRTIPLQRNHPANYAVVGRPKGKATMELQALRFPKKQGWTADSAQKWVDEHPDVKKGAGLGDLGVIAPMPGEAGSHTDPDYGLGGTHAVGPITAPHVKKGFNIEYPGDTPAGSHSANVDVDIDKDDPCTNEEYVLDHPHECGVRLSAAARKAHFAARAQEFARRRKAYPGPTSGEVHVPGPIGTMRGVVKPRQVSDEDARMFDHENRWRDPRTGIVEPHLNAIKKAMGGSGEVWDEIARSLPEHSVFVALTAGRDGILWAKQPAGREIANADDPDQAFRLRYVKEMTPENLEALHSRQWVADRALWDRLRIMHPKTALDRFHKLAYLARYTNKAGDGFDAFAPSDLRADNLGLLQRRLAHVALTRLDLPAAIKRFDSPKTLFFAAGPFDPEQAPMAQGMLGKAVMFVQRPMRAFPDSLKADLVPDQDRTVVAFRAAGYREKAVRGGTLFMNYNPDQFKYYGPGYTAEPAGPGIAKGLPERLEVRLIGKADDEKRLVYGVVMEPDTVDTQGDFARADVIEQAAHAYLAHYRLLGEQHQKVARRAEVVESYIAPANFQMGDQMVRKGSWFMVTHVLDPHLWDDIKQGKYTGYSIGGFGESVPADKSQMHEWATPMGTYRAPQ